MFSRLSIDSLSHRAYAAGIPPLLAARTRMTDKKFQSCGVPCVCGVSFATLDSGNSGGRTAADFAVEVGAPKHIVSALQSEHSLWGQRKKSKATTEDATPLRVNSGIGRAQSVCASGQYQG